MLEESARGGRVPQRNTQSREEIIEIKENSEGEADEKLEEKIEAKDEVKSEAKDQRPSQIQAAVDQTGESLKTKERLDENVSAEDIVEEITELTNPGLFDQSKNKRAKPSTNKKPVKKPSEEPAKPAGGKTYAVNEEGEAQAHTGKNLEGDAGGVQVISSSDDEAQGKDKGSEVKQ